MPSEKYKTYTNAFVTADITATTWKDSFMLPLPVTATAYKAPLIKMKLHITFFYSSNFDVAIRLPVSANTSFTRPSINQTEVLPNSPI